MKWSESRLVVSDSLQPHRLYNPWNSPGQNTGVGSRSLLQGIFRTQGSRIAGRFFTKWAIMEDKCAAGGSKNMEFLYVIEVILLFA